MARAYASPLLVSARIGWCTLLLLGTASAFFGATFGIAQVFYSGFAVMLFCAVVYVGATSFENLLAISVLLAHFRAELATTAPPDASASPSVTRDRRTPST